MRWQSLTLSVVATSSICTAGSSPAIIYKWRVYLGKQLLPTLSSSSADPKSFKLPPYKLNSGLQYSVQVEVSHPKSLSSNTDAATVLVGRAGVNAVISGGANQLLSNKERNFLDASTSNDIDYPGKNNLAFAWQCIQFYPNYGSACGFNVMTNSSVLSIPANI